MLGSIVIAGCAAETSTPTVARSTTRRISNASPADHRSEFYTRGSAPSALKGPPKHELRLLAWRMGGVDPRFELSTAEARTRVREALAQWETAAGRKLFIEDDVTGFPVDWIFDERQEKVIALAENRERVKRSEADLKVLRAAVERSKEEVESRFHAYERQKDALKAKLDDFNTRVSEWNLKGGAPDSVREAMEQEQREIESERHEINGSLTELNSFQQEVQEQVDALNLKVLAHNELLLKAKLDSGLFFEKVGVCETKGSRVEHIKVFAFRDQTDLTRILTHEFGHALGLGHVEGPIAIMNSVSKGELATTGVCKADRAELKRALSRRPG